MLIEIYLRLRPLFIYFKLSGIVASENGEKMLNKSVRAVFVALLSVGLISTPALADSAKPGQSMTHIKTEKGISSKLEAAGVVLYVQGGATTSVMGESISSPEGQIVFHVPVTGTKAGVQHIGSNLVLFNTNNNNQLLLRNPLIDLRKGVVTAIIGQGNSQAVSIFTITNAADLKPKIVNDKKSKLRTTSYEGAKLAFAPGVAASVTSLLGMPEGSLAEGVAFASAGVTLHSPIKTKK